MTETYSRRGIETEIKENEKMEKTLKIEGMMCGHCEARVRKALEALPQVALAEVSHAQGTAVVTLSAETNELTVSIEELLNTLGEMDGVVKAEFHCHLSIICGIFGEKSV